MPPINYSCASAPQRRSRGRCRLKRPLWRSRREEWSFASPWSTPLDTATPSTARTGVFMCRGGVGSDNNRGTCFLSSVLSHPSLPSSTPVLMFHLETPRFLPLLPRHSLCLDFCQHCLVCVCLPVCHRHASDINVAAVQDPFPADCAGIAWF